MNLDQQYYHPGDDVHFSVEVVNESTKQVKKATLAFITLGHVSAMSYTDDYDRKVNAVRLPEIIQPGESRSFDATLHIPDDYNKYSLSTSIWWQQFAVRASSPTQDL